MFVGVKCLSKPRTQHDEPVRVLSQMQIFNLESIVSIYNLAIWLQSVFITSDEDKILDLEAKLATCKAYPAQITFASSTVGRNDWR